MVKRHRISRVAGLLQVALVLVLLPGAERLCGQETAPPASPRALSIPIPDALDTNGPVATLHVYTNLMQVPVLVLTSDHQRARPVRESEFRLSLDSGPVFKPTHVRREGDDPIELAVLFDASGGPRELLPKMDEAIAALAPEHLREWDHVSIYMMDCNLIRTAYDMPADAAHIRTAVDNALQVLRARPQEKKALSACKSPVQLWDAMSFATQDLYKLRGRRVLLTVSNGLDHGSHTNWNQLRRMAQETSTAVFGLMTPEQMQAGHAVPWTNRDLAMHGSMGATIPAAEDPYNIVCESSGGLEFTASGRSLPKELVRLTQMVRERYIIEYPRSNSATAGVHDLHVTVGNGLTFVRPAGISVPLADKKALANPLTLPSEAATPIEGQRRALKPDPE